MRDCLVFIIPQVSVIMVAKIPLDDIDRVNYRFACRVFNKAWLMIPSPVYFWLETRAWEVSVREEIEDGLEAASIFPIRFEELLFTHFGDMYDIIVQEVL